LLRATFEGSFLEAKRERDEIDVPFVMRELGFVSKHLRADMARALRAFQINEPIEVGEGTSEHYQVEQQGDDFVVIQLFQQYRLTSSWPDVASQVGDADRIETVVNDALVDFFHRIGEFAQGR
jgi:hypothetical protein